MKIDVVVLDPAAHRGLRGSTPRHGKEKLYALGCRCDECVAGDAGRRADAVARVARWQKANPEKLKALTARHRDLHREKRRSDGLARYHRLMTEDPERVRANRRAWAKTPKGALANRLARHTRRGARPDALAREYVEIILCDPCALCGVRPVEVDHITPLVVGGEGTWENLAPLCRSCNASKNGGGLLPRLVRSF